MAVVGAVYLCRISFDGSRFASRQRPSTRLYSVTSSKWDCCTRAIVKLTLPPCRGTHFSSGEIVKYLSTSLKNQFILLLTAELNLEITIE